MDNQADPVAKSELLDSKLSDGLDAEIDAMFAFSRRTRAIAYMVVVLLVFMLVLSVAVGVVAFQAKHAASTASVARHDQAVACRTGNDFRDNNRQLWAYLLGLPPPAPLTPEQVALRAQLRAHIDSIFADRVCLK